MVDYMAVFIKKSHAAQFGIHSITDLARQSTVKYGVLADGATQDFFRSSRSTFHSMMWSTMSWDGNASFVQTIAEGIERVLSSTDEHPWAFLSESASLKYVTARRCDVEVLVDEMFPRYLALAVPLGSSYLTRLTVSLLTMLEGGLMHMLQRKWWNPVVHCEQSPHE